MNFGPIGNNGKGLNNILQYVILDPPCLTSRKNKIRQVKEAFTFHRSKVKGALTQNNILYYDYNSALRVQTSTKHMEILKKKTWICTALYKNCVYVCHLIPFLFLSLCCIVLQLPSILLVSIDLPTASN